jgi:hypothetical protein
MLLYDPPTGWMHGFPKPYEPLPGETLRDTLIRDGYPASAIDDTVVNHCRFLGPREELDRLRR